jgi:hypothetical protein
MELTIEQVLNKDIINNNLWETFNQCEHTYKYSKTSESLEKLAEDISNTFSTLAMNLFEHFTSEVLSYNDEEIRNNVHTYRTMWKTLLNKIFSKYQFLVDFLKSHDGIYKGLLNRWEYSFENHIIYIYLTEAINTSLKNRYAIIVDELIKIDKMIEFSLDKFSKKLGLK